MKLYSDIITREDIYSALPADVSAEVREINTRQRAHGYEIHLEGLGARHTRRRNSGYYGAREVDEIGHYGYAATWDDHGVWMAALYEIDPLARIASYSDRDNFYEATANEHKWRQHSARPYRSTAPWLTETADV